MLPDSFVERFRAAAAASEAREADRESKAAGGHETAKDRGAPADPTTQGKPAAVIFVIAPSSTGYEWGAKTPREKLRQPFSAGSIPGDAA